MGVRLQVASVVLVGLLASAAAGLLMHAAEADNAGQAVDRRVITAHDALDSTIQRYVDAVQLVAGALSALPDLNPRSFALATEPLGQMWLPGATSVDFVVPVDGAGVATLQAGWRAKGLPDLTLTPVGIASEHLFPIMQRSLDVGTTTAIGLDVSQSGELIAALRHAQRVGLPAVSEPHLLLRDVRLPTDRRQESVVLVQRIYDKDRGVIRGYVQMPVRMQDFFTDTMLQPARDLLDVTLLAPHGSGLIRVADLQRDGGSRADLRRTIPLRVADQQWQLRVATDKGAVDADGHLDDGMFLSGVVITALAAFLVYTLATLRRQAEDRVATATAELRCTALAAGKQANLLGAVMDAISDGVVVVDGFGEPRWFNPTARELLGPDVDSCPLGEWAERFGIFEVDGTTPYKIQNVLNGARRAEIEVVIRPAGRPAGARVEARVCTLEQEGEPPGGVAVLRDVTARRQAEEQLHASEELQQLLLDGARDYAIFMLDPDGRVVSWSANAERIMGYGGEEIIGYRYATFFSAEDVAAGMPERNLAIAADRGRVEIDGIRVRKDGTTYWAHGLLTAVHDKDGSIRGYVKVSQDITHRKAADRAIEQLNAELEQRVEERTAELESFSYSVSHDLRAPLRAVDGFAKMLILDHGDQLDEQGRRYLSRIRAGAQHMGQLIDGLLALHRLQRQEMALQPVRIGELVTAVWDELAVERADRDITLVTRELPDAIGDPLLIRHVVANLIGNAVKYTRDAAPARVEVGHSVTTGGQATYFVRDNGAGFDMRYADKLFKVFQRLHRAEDYEGTGIGLALVHRIIDRHGGQIWADATIGAGATFYFTLPAGAGEEVACDATSIAGRGQSR